MKPRAIALVGYPGDYFFNFAQGLVDSNFQVFWICATAYEAKMLRKKGVPAKYILDTMLGFNQSSADDATIRHNLSLLENTMRNDQV